MLNVCWLTLSPAPYTIKLFNEISKKINLSVILFDKVEKNRNSEWTIKNDCSFNLYIIDSNYHKRIKELAKENDVLVDGYYLSIYGYMAVREFKKNNKKTFIIADGGISKNRGKLVNGIMSYLMKRHDYCMSSSEITDRYFKYYGISENIIYHYKFTSLTNEDIKQNVLLTKQKDELRKELELSDKFILLSVGQPIKRKGFDILLKVFYDSKLYEDINLYIIGGEPENNTKEFVMKNNLKNVHFVNILNSNELKKYYAASDAFILCTREDIWGLVIEEAMSFGLPIITSNNCVAGLHFAQNSSNPIICDVNDINGYSKSLIELYKNIVLRETMSKEAIDNIFEFSIENSANDIVDILTAKIVIKNNH